MSEKKLIIDQVKFVYEGLFDLNGFYRLIDSFFYEKNWDKNEKMNWEAVTPTGKHIRLEYFPFKNVTDYYQNHIKMRVNFIDVVKVEVEKDGAKIKLDKGKVSIIFDCYVLSDRYDKWTKTPFLWFIRTIIDKYVFKDHFLKMQRWLISDFEELHTQVKSFFNVYRHYERGQFTRAGTL